MITLQVKSSKLCQVSMKHTVEDMLVDNRKLQDIFSLINNLILLARLI